MASVESTLRAGSARRCITPTRPLFQSGYGRSAKSEGVYQHLYARALVLEDDSGRRVALLTAELLDFSESLVARTKAGVEARLGLAADQVLLSASHTHCGPVVDDAISNLYAEVDMEYVQWLGEICIEALCAAAAELVPVRAYFAVGRAAFGINRRRPDLPGCPMAPNPGGRWDPDVAVVRLVRADGETLAVLFSYTCHATVMGGQLIGGDYPGQAQLSLEQEFPGAQAMFLAGCFGDVRPRLINAKGQFKSGTLDDVRALGRELALAVMAALAGPPQEITGPLRYGLATVALPYQPALTEGELQARAVAGEGAEARWAKAMLARRQRDGAPPSTRPSTIQSLGIGPFRLLAFNDEMCLGYQLALKQALAPAPTLVAGYCGSSRSYVPTADMLPEGGYEAYSNIWSYLEPAPLAAETEVILLEAALRLAREG
jgi:hypothetical protein